MPSSSFLNETNALDYPIPDACKPGHYWVIQSISMSDLHFCSPPGLKPLSTETDTCVTTATRSGMPYIDMITPEIGVAIGGNGVGARLAYEIGRIAAKMIMKGHWDYDISPDLFKVRLRAQSCKL